MPSFAPDHDILCERCGARSNADADYCGKCGSALTSGMPSTGDIIADRYRIVAQIGKGAMGTVYRVEHVQIGKPMAVKLLHRELEQNTEHVTRFHREAESASKLNHPNTVQVFDFGRSKSGWLYLAMEYVAGPDLGKLFQKEGALPFGRAAYLCSQVAASVADAHAVGIVHRDLKPENIVVSQRADGELVKVLDFGLAKLFESKLESQVTGSGTIVGTPSYMSPEQIRGEELDGRSDIYSIGAIMYEAVVGRPPFEATNPIGVLSKHLTERPALPSTRSPLSVPTEADQIIARCLHKEREQRYSTAEELRLELLAYLATVVDQDWRLSSVGQPTLALGSGRRSVAELNPISKKRRPWLWLAVAIALVGVGFGGWQYATAGPHEREPNHAERRATPLPPHQLMKAYLGRRISDTEGDIDLFRIHTTGADDAVALEVSAIPNMDVVVELLKPGDDVPVVVGDSRGVGEGERLPNVPVEAGTYLIRVRELEEAGPVPTENVSDEYFVRWERRPHEPEFEREFNDSVELAETLELAEERRGWIGWPGDVDTFCLGENAKRVVAQVSALTNVDLVLRLVDRRTQRSRKHDANGPGRGETSKVWRKAKAGKLCVQVSADPGSGEAHGAEPYETYGVRFRSAETL